MYCMVLYVLVLALTAVLCHDLLFFDEFEYSFNLKREEDWEHYHIDKLLSTPQNAQNAQNWAATCTQKIPLIMKQLCVHWKHDHGFKYHFQTPSAAHTHDTNWYYTANRYHRDDNRVSDAHAANAYYSTLEDHTRYIGDDSDWNEINYLNALSSFTLDNEENNDRHYFENFAKGSFKQCRHSLRMRECVEFHLPSKTLKVNVKIGRARKQKTFRAKEVMPSNMDELESETQKANQYAAKAGLRNEYSDEEQDENVKSAYDFHGEFEYGDSMGYDHWANDVMQWQSFQCINCMNHRRLSRDEMVSSDYAAYGDYTYLFNEYALDYDNDMDWNQISSDKQLKCSIAIPGFEHKLCVDMSNAATSDKGAAISFAGAEQKEIDYGYYDIYGYDAYYYNMDHLYPNARRLMKDDDDYESNDEDYEIGYDAIEEFYDAINAQFIDSLRNELNHVTLHFLDDNAWDDITTMYDADKAKSIRKCASFQVSRLCATHSLSNPTKALKFNLKIGKHKYHRSSMQKYVGSHPIFRANIAYDDETDITTQKQQHWVIHDETMDIDDDEWNDPQLWTPQNAVETRMLQKMVQQRCRHHSLCVCQYMDQSFDHGRKHPCAQGNPRHPQKVVHVMDDFVKNPKAEFIPLPEKKSSPLHIEFHYKPHIQHLHVVGGLPFFHRRNHVKRYKIPWYKYARYEHIRPRVKPDWLPHWMWREIGSHTHYDPMKFADIMRDMKREGQVGYMQHTPQGVGPQLQQLAQQLHQLEGHSQPPPQPQTPIGLFTAHEMEAGDDMERYYDYDAQLEDELDAMEEDGASEAVDYMFPLMQNAARAVLPLFDALHSMMGVVWNTVAQKVGIRRRMEDDEAVMDAWFDRESGLNWMMRSDALSAEDLMQFNAAHFEIDNDIIGSSGKAIQKKCTNLFGKQVCICQFLAFIGIADTKQDHLCYPRRSGRKDKKMARTESKLLKYGVNKETVATIDKAMKLGTMMSDIKEESAWIKKEANTIRDTVKSGLPRQRPAWFPHYFWHWLHSAPHFHVLLHRKRVPWVAASSARYAYAGAAAQQMRYNYYEYGDASEVDYEEMEDEMYDGMSDIINSDMAVNALGNGDDFMGNAESVTDEVWRFESILLFGFAGVLFCLVASCFLWRSKWGGLIRKLNEQRIERKERLYRAKRMNELMSGDIEEESSSLNISDVTPIHDE